MDRYSIIGYIERFSGIDNTYTTGGLPMVQLIVGEKGKGKTKLLLDKVNSEVKDIAGNIVYLDKSTKHMYELNNKVRLIDVSQYMFESCDEFVGFVCGIISQDHDLQQMYFDSFLDISCLKDADVTEVIEKLDKIGEKFGVAFIISMSMDGSKVPQCLKDKIIAAL